MIGSENSASRFPLSTVFSECRYSTFSTSDTSRALPISAIAVAPVAMQRQARLMRANQLAVLGRHARAAEDVEAATAGKVDQLWFLAVDVCVRCAAAAGKDTKLDKAEREKLAEKHAARAVALMAKICDTPPFRDGITAEDLAEEPVLRPLRDRADFRRLLDEIRKRPK